MGMKQSRMAMKKQGRMATKAMQQRITQTIQHMLSTMKKNILLLVMLVRQMSMWQTTSSMAPKLMAQASMVLVLATRAQTPWR